MSAIDWLRILEGCRHCFRSLRVVVLMMAGLFRTETRPAEEQDTPAHS